MVKREPVGCGPTSGMTVTPGCQNRQQSGSRTQQTGRGNILSNISPGTEVCFRPTRMALTTRCMSPGTSEKQRAWHMPDEKSMTSMRGDRQR